MADHQKQEKNKADYLVLARKYRPSTFDELVGQDAMVRTLANAINSGRLAHAFVLTGVRGVGKTTTARLIAKAVNCVGPDGKGGVTATPCGQCDNCKSIAESRHVDVLEMDAASRTGVDDVREIIDSVQYAPVSGRYKVYIIDEVHMLSKNAFNALLKTLEEPPPHVKFIFATTEVRKLPVTVLSRCQRFDLRRVPGEMLVEHLKSIVDKEKADVEGKAISLIARAAEGSVRDSLSLMDQAIAHGGGKVSETEVRTMLGLADRAQILDLLEYIMGGKIEEALKISNDQMDLGADPIVILKDLADVTHWITRLKVTPDAGADALVSEAERTKGADMAGKLSMAHLSRAWQMLLKGILEVQTASLPQAAAEMVLIRMAYAADMPTPAETIRKLGSEKPESPAAHSTETKSATPAVAESTGTATSQPTPTKNPEPKTETTTAQQTGATILALKTTEGEAQADEPMPLTFRDMIALFDRKKEPVIATSLFDDVSLCSYQPGKIAFSVVGSVKPTLASRMRECLKTWTGNDWQVILENTPKEPTLREQEEAAQNKLEEEVRADPNIKALFKAFPQAKIVHIQPAGTAMLDITENATGEEDEDNA